MGGIWVSRNEQAVLFSVLLKGTFAAEAISVPPRSALTFESYGERPMIDVWGLGLMSQVVASDPAAVAGVDV